MAGCGQRSAEVPGLPLPGGGNASYEIRYSNQSLSDVRPLLAGRSDSPVPGLAHTYRTELKGILHVQHRDSMTTNLWLDVVAIELDVDGMRSSIQEDVLRNQLSLGASIRLQPDGQLKSTVVPRSLSPMAMGCWQAIATRIVRTAGPQGAREWQAIEPDPNGRVRVQYRVPNHPRNAPVLLERTRLELLPPLSADAPVTESTTEGLSQFSLDGSTGMLIRFDGEDRTDITLGNAPVAVSKTELHLQSVKEPWKARQSPVGDFIELFEGKVDLPVDRAAVERKRLAAISTAEVWKLVQDGHPEATLYLKALLYLRPEQCREAERRFRSFPDLISGALADAGHAAAQEALRHLEEKLPNDPALEMKLLAAMGALANPEPATIEHLKENALEDTNASVRSTALLSLGRLANVDRKPGSAHASALVPWLLDMYTVQRPPPWQLDVLLALGNAGDSRALPVLKKAFASEDPAMKEAAVFALRWLPEEEAQHLIENALQADSSSSVRRRAVAALSLRRNDRSLRALLAASRDTDATVRAAILDALAKWPLSSEIEKAAEIGLTDLDEDVQRAAEALLRR